MVVTGETEGVDDVIVEVVVVLVEVEVDLVEVVLVLEELTADTMLKF